MEEEHFWFTFSCLPCGAWKSMATTDELQAAIDLHTGGAPGMAKLLHFCRTGEFVPRDGSHEISIAACVRLLGEATPPGVDEVVARAAVMA